MAVTTDIPDDTSPTPNVERAPTPRRGGGGRVLAGVMLLAIGLVFLLGNLLLVPTGGGALLVALATAFAVGRATTGAVGLAVPAGVLAGVGSFVWLSDAAPLVVGPGTFLVALGCGFLLTYAIAWRAAAVWPLYPATALIGLGVLVDGFGERWPLASVAWIAAYWPLVLVAIGGWLLLRDVVPGPARTPIAVTGTLLIVAYAVLTMAALAAESAPSLRSARPWLGLPAVLSRAAPATTETENRDLPIGPASVLRIANPSGTIRVTAGPVSSARVQVLRRSWVGAPAPGVAYEQTADGWSIRPDVAGAFAWNRGYLDITAEVPASVSLIAETASGDVEVRGLSGAVEIASASGALTVRDVAGPVVARAASGSLRVDAATGALALESVSGDVIVTDFRRLQSVRTVSGSIRLAGEVTDALAIQTTSGSVRLALTPNSLGRITLTTLSGSLRIEGLNLSDARQESRRLTGTLRGGQAPITVNTVSGDVLLTAR